MKWLRRLWGALAIALPLLANPAPAADCGDTSGAGGTDVPCNCGDSVTTSTRLGLADPVVSTGPEDFCPIDGGNFQIPVLRIAAGVNLDVNQQHIRGDRQVCGILIAGDGATVRNGTFTHFLFFAICSGAGNPNLPDAGPFNAVSILGNTAPDLLGGGIGIVGGNDHRIENNRSGTGIFILPLTQAVPEGSTLAGNVVSGQNGNENNSIPSSSPATGGIALIGNRFTVRGNKVLGQTAGIWITGSDSVIENNETSDNVLLNGIEIHGNGHTVRRNLARQNGFRGLYVDGAGNNVTNNWAAGNMVGILVTGSGNTLTGNKAGRNLEQGIVATGLDGDNVDGGGNFGAENVFGQCTIDGAPCAP